MKSGSFFRFLTVGAGSTILNYATFALLYTLGIAYALAGILGYLTGMAFGYALNRSWTFSTQDRATITEAAAYLFVYLASLFINTGVLLLSVESFGVDPLLGNIIAIGVSTLTNYAGCRIFVFRPSKSEE